MQDSLQIFRNSGNMLQESRVTGNIFTFQVDFTARGPHTRQAGRCSKSSTRQEELPHNSRPFFTPRRTPTQIEALLHAKKNSHTMRGPSSLQKDSQCARGPSSMNNSPTKRLMSQRTQETYYGGRTTASIQLFFN